MALRQEVLTRRSQKVTRSEVLAMRNRICKELSKETVGNIDLKLGRGGIIDIEFVTQYLQISRCTQYPSLLCQDTVNALRRLGNIGIIDAQEALTIQDSYKFLRTIEAILRLSGESVLKTEGQQFNQTATFLDIEPERLMGKLMEVKRHNEDFLYKYLG
jgi:glutamine synthetase adenylyltransferase